MSLLPRFSLCCAGLALALCAACATTPQPWRDEDHLPKPPLVGTNETEMPTAMMKQTDVLAYRAQGQAELSKAVAAVRTVKVFFALDEAALTVEATDTLKAVAGVLKRHTDLDVSIQGNADERGTAAHNQVLGQKRADAVKAYLAAQGVNTGQIKAVSFGEQNPADPAHTDDAYAKNRNAQVVAVPEKKAAEPAKK